MLEDEIGLGAYGQVYEASQPSLGRKVAVKFFSSTFDDGASRKRFERESRLLARIDHPAIPFVITRGKVEEDNTPYVVMQLVRGKTLAEVVRRDGSMATEDAVTSLLGILSALQAAHDAKVIHRDVKPDNVVMSPHGPVLIDFSIGICLEYSPGLTRATRQGDRVGNSVYASPEQQKDSLSVDQKTDIYSAGIVLFEMLVGHARYNRDRLRQMLHAHPVGLVSVIERACTEDLDRRFAAAADFGSALRPFAPQAVPVQADGPAICPNPSCSSGIFSGAGYFRGPTVLLDALNPHCESCGVALTRACPACMCPIPTDIGDRIVTLRRAEEDRRTAYCGSCGALIYETPTCGKCGSFLRTEDMGKDTAKRGCAKCRKKKPSTGYGTGRPGIPDSAGFPDDDIPF